MRDAILLSLLAGLISALTHKATEEQEMRDSGIAVRINQKALDYVTPQLSHILQHLLERASLPTLPLGPITLDDVRIYEFERPIIYGSFVKGKGIHASVTLPHAYIMGQASVAFSFFEYNEHIQLTVENAKIDIEMHFSRDPRGNLARLEHCHMNAFFIKTEYKGRVLNWFHSFIERKIESAIRKLVCQKALNKLVYILNKPVMGDSLSTKADGSLSSFCTASHPVDRRSKGPPQIVKDFARDLCEIENRGKVNPTISISATTSSSSTPSPWKVNTSLRYRPEFTYEHVTIGLNGGITYNNNTATVDKPTPVATDLLGNKILGAAISDYVPNSILAHIFDQRLGIVKFDISADDLLFFVTFSRGSAQTVICMEYSISRIIINEKCVSLMINGSISIFLSTNTLIHRVADATVSLHVTMNPTVRKNTIFPQIELHEVRVEIQKLRFVEYRLLRKAVANVVKIIVKNIVWPRINEQWQINGVHLPSLCGLQLQNLSVSLVRRAVIVQTDVKYDTIRFIRKFKRFVNEKMEAAKLRKVYEI